MPVRPVHSKKAFVLICVTGTPLIAAGITTLPASLSLYPDTVADFAVISYFRSPSASQTSSAASTVTDVMTVSGRTPATPESAIAAAQIRMCTLFVSKPPFLYSHLTVRKYYNILRTEKQAGSEILWMVQRFCGLKRGTDSFAFCSQPMKCTAWIMTKRKKER